MTEKQNQNVSKGGLKMIQKWVKSGKSEKVSEMAAKIYGKVAQKIYQKGRKGGTEMALKWPEKCVKHGSKVSPKVA